MYANAICNLFLFIDFMDLELSYLFK
jgi:hypothetical protein